MYRLLLIKRSVENVFIFPFILIGRLISRISPLKEEYSVFFFFSFYQTGGAEKVHANIVQAVSGNKSLVLFTRHSIDERFLEDFKKSGAVLKDISKYTDNKWLYFLNLIYRGIISGYINKQKTKALVFNGQCNFAYKISPWVKKSVGQIELIHSFNTFSFIRIPFIPFINKTVMISRKRIEDHKQLYKRYNIPIRLSEKIIYIPNGIEIPSHVMSDRPSTPFKVIYSGRTSPEKRIYLIIEMAKELWKTNRDIQFEMIGNVAGSVDIKSCPYIKLHGAINDEKKMNSIYAGSHLLLITSSAEGFPMVIMEAMANGCAVMGTPVGDIPFHIKEGTNGFLFSSTENELAIIKEGIEKIIWMKNQKEEWNKISTTNIQYAVANFGIERFNSAYKELLM